MRTMSMNVSQYNVLTSLSVCLPVCVNQWGRRGIPRWQHQWHLPPSEIPDWAPLHQVSDSGELVAARNISVFLFYWSFWENCYDEKKKLKGCNRGIDHVPKFQYINIRKYLQMFVGPFSIFWPRKLQADTYCIYSWSVRYRWSISTLHFLSWYS